MQLMSKRDQQLQENLLNISYSNLFDKLEDYVNAIEETSETHASV